MHTCYSTGIYNSVYSTSQFYRTSTTVLFRLPLNGPTHGQRVRIHNFFRLESFSFACAYTLYVSAISSCVPVSFVHRCFSPFLSIAIVSAGCVRFHLSLSVLDFYSKSFFPLSHGFFFFKYIHHGNMCEVGSHMIFIALQYYLALVLLVFSRLYFSWAFYL